MAIDKFIATSRTVSAGKKPKAAHLLRDEKSHAGSCGCCSKGEQDPPAKPSERISGSDRNREGSASGSRGGIDMSDATVSALKEKVEQHNEKHGDKEGKKVDLGMLKAVWRRGAGAFSTSHRPGMGREQWAMARVNAFLFLVRTGRPEDKQYVTDNDLLPKGHPKRSESKRIHSSHLWTGDAEHSPEIMVKDLGKDALREFAKIEAREDELGKSVGRIFDRQVKRVLEKIAAADVPTPELAAEVEVLLKSRAWRKELVSALRPYLEDALAAGIALGTQTLKNLGSLPANFEKRGDDLRAYARSESIRLADRSAASVNGYTAVKFSKVIGDGVANGESIPEIADRVKAWATKDGDAERATTRRALVIARTEAQRATRRAEVAAWKASGVVAGKTWLLAPDPCEFCQAASDQFSTKAIGLDDAFYGEGSEIQGADGNVMVADYEAIEGPPLHPNCRCSLQPAFDGELEAMLKEAEEEMAEDLAEIERKATEKQS